MPHAGPLRQILRALTVEDLKEIQTRHAPRISEYNDDKEEFVGRLRGSISRSKDVTYETLMETILDIRSADTRWTTTRIKDALNGLKVSPNVGWKDTTSVRERWISSEAFQALRYEFRGQPYEISQEESFGRAAPDLFVSHRNGRKNYVVEVKLAGGSARDKLPTQLRRYEEKIPYRKQTYVFMIVERERDLPENKTSVRHVIDEVEKRDRTEVILKPPSDLRYDPS